MRVKTSVCRRSTTVLVYIHRRGRGPYAPPAENTGKGTYAFGANNDHRTRTQLYVCSAVRTL